MTHIDTLARCKDWIEQNTLPDTEAKMVWIDVETDGLDPEGGHLLEIGLFVTDQHGFLVENGVFQQVVSHRDIDWQSVDPFVQGMHERSRLKDEVLAMHTKLNALYEIEGRAVAFLQEHFGEDMADLKLPIAGSSVDFDKRWIEKHMPLLREQFGYRVIDNSSTKEQVKLLNPELAAGVDVVWTSIKAHRVVPDLIDTIEEYRYYVAEFFWTVENAQGFAVEVAQGHVLLSTGDAEAAQRMIEAEQA